MMLRQSSRLLLPPAYRTSFRSANTRVSAKQRQENDQKEYLQQNLPADLFKILMETKTTDRYWFKTIEMTVFEKIQTYKADYTEKTVLLDQAVADRISQCVLTHTRGDKTTTFFDGEGGLCHIAENISKVNLFKEVCVIEKDLEGLVSLNGYAKNPSIPVHDVNLHMTAALYNQDRQTLIPPLLKHLPGGKVSEDVPSFTIVMTASPGLVKYLTQRILFCDNPFGELFSARPEFFLIVTPRTYFHLCCGFSTAEPDNARVTEEQMRDKNKQTEKQGKLMLTYNLLFQFLCDYCLVDILPREAFFPWKKHQRHFYRSVKRNNRTTSNDHYYEANQDKLMMIYVRPRKPEELGIGNPKYLEHFLVQILKHRKKKVVELFEEWSTGWGFVLIESGYTIISEVRDLGIDDLMALYMTVINLPDLEHSNFVAEALDYHAATHAATCITTEEMEEFRINYMRKLSIGEEYFETED